jgi:DNA-binding CsgD family transcriptional regulator
LEIADFDENRKVIIIDKALLDLDDNKISNAKIICLTVSDDIPTLQKIIKYANAKVKNHDSDLLLEKKKEFLLDNFQLTQGEKKIYKYIESGMTRTEIANKLALSKITVRNTISRILKKISVKSSQEAVKKVKKMLID